MKGRKERKELERKDVKKGKEKGKGKKIGEKRKEKKRGNMKEKKNDREIEPGETQSMII